MTRWLLNSIGIGGEITQHVEQLDWLVARPLYLWIAILGVPLVFWLIAMRHRSSLGHIRPLPRHVLTLCRVSFFVLLMFVLAGPYVRLHQQIDNKPVLAVIVDESASMDLSAGPIEGGRIGALARVAGLLASDGAVDDAAREKLNDMTRAQLVSHVLAAQRHDLFMPLAERFDVRWYRVATDVRRVDFDWAPTPLPAEAAADTALGAAMKRAIDEAAGRAIAGIVVLSDGRSTRGVAPEAVVREVAASNATEAPVFTVPIGAEASPGADVGVIDLLMPERVSAKDTVNVIATVASAGMSGRRVEVRLVEADQVLDKVTLTLDDRPTQQVTLTTDAPEAGVRLLSVEIEPQPEEAVTANNRRQASLEVDAQKRKVFLLEGYPRWDFRFLDHEFRRDHGLDVTVVMESALVDAGVAAADLPSQAKLPQEVDGWAEYDLVMLGDVSPQLLTPAMQEQLAAAIEERGVGLIVQAGFAQMPHAFMASNDSPLARLLPVRIDATRRDLPGGRGTIGGLDAEPFAPFRMAVTANGAIHPAMRLYPNAERNRSVWNQMPSFFWAAATIEPRPAATVLGQIEHRGRTLPLLAEHWAGRGRVLFIGFDSTYRWRRNIGSALFGRFWNQAIRHVARSEQRGGDQTLLLASPARVEVGEPVTVELFLADQDRRSAPGESIPINVIAADDTREMLSLKAVNETGQFSGVWRGQRQGSYTLSFTGGSGEASTATVAVTASGREQTLPTVDRPGLRMLASMSGGAMLELDELASLPDRLEGEASTVSRVVEDEIWDNWLMLIMLVGLYCTDVGVRRLHGLT